MIATHLEETQPGAGATPSASGLGAANVLAAGEAVGDYLIEELVAAGGQAVVYRGRHRDTGAPAALKVLRSDLSSDPAMIQRLLREAEVLGRLEHPNVVRVLDVGIVSSGRLFLATEWAEGRTLADWLREQGRFDLSSATAVALQLCSALTAAHRLQIVHRDVKASNIVVRDEATWELKLLDFGIAKLLLADQEVPALTQQGQRVGTRSVMAPEQIAGTEVDARSDVYALGVLLFQLLTGRLPFVASTAFELERMHLEQPAPRPSLLAPVPVGVEAVILRCLEKAPERRFQDVASLVSELTVAALEGEG